MKARDKPDWQPTKYHPKGKGWKISPNRAELSPASTISATLALDATLEVLKLHASGHFADFGCGTAPFYGAYRPLVDTVSWIDWPSSPHMTRHLDVVADLNLPLDIASDSFDTVFASSVLEHIWKHDIFLDEVGRVLRPDGKIILVVPFMYWLHEEPHDFFRWTRHALARACDERGFEIIKLEPYGGGIDLMVDLFVRALASFNLTLAKLVGRPCARLIGHRTVRRFGQTSREKLPLGYVLVARKLV